MSYTTTVGNGYTIQPGPHTWSFNAYKSNGCCCGHINADLMHGELVVTHFWNHAEFDGTNIQRDLMDALQKSAGNKHLRIIPCNLYNDRY